MDNPKVTMSGKAELTVDGEIRFRRGASRSEFTMAYPYDSTVSEAIKRAGLPKSHRVHWSDQRKADVVRAVTLDLSTRFLAPGKIGGAGPFGADAPAAEVIGED